MQRSVSSLFAVVEYWRRGWDSHHCRVMQTKNLEDFAFLTVQWIRSKAWVATRIEHAEGDATVEEPAVGIHPNQPGRTACVDHA